MDDKQKKVGSLVAAIIVPQLIGGLGALATARSVNTWFRRLRKPSWNPPGAIFGPIWTTLYLMMGIASWLVFRAGQERRAPQVQVESALKLYGVQLVFNLLWSFIFFGMRNLRLAMAEIVVLWSFILATLVNFVQINPLAGVLLLPYQLWTTFATALNAALWRLNPDK
jgi:benzodiazapine receptor